MVQNAQPPPLPTSATVLQPNPPPPEEAAKLALANEFLLCYFFANKYTYLVR